MPAMIAEPSSCVRMPRAFLGLNQHVVGPAQVAGQIGGLQDRFARRPSPSASVTTGNASGGKRVPQNDGDVQARAGFGMPHSPVAPLSGGLFFGAHHSARIRSRPRPGGWLRSWWIRCVRCQWMRWLPKLGLDALDRRSFEIVERGAALFELRDVFGALGSQRFHHVGGSASSGIFRSQAAGPCRRSVFRARRSLSPAAAALSFAIHFGKLQQQGRNRA